MNGFLAVIKREISKIKADNFIMTVLFIAPLFFSFIVWYTFSAGVLTDMPVAVLDLDNSDITRKITRAINAAPSVKVKYKVQNYNEGYDLIKSAKAYALIVFPDDFKKDLNRNKRPKIIYYYNNQTILIGGVITKDIQSAVSIMAKGSLIKVDEHIKSNPYLNYSYFLTYAAIAHIFQVFAALLAIWTIGVEFKDGTTKQWLKEANDSIINAVFGKLTVYLTVLMLEMIIIYSLYVLLYGAPFEGNILFTIFSSAVFILAYQMMGMMFVAILSNLRFVMSVGAFYTSLGFSLAGMTYPDMAMPLFARVYGSFLPVKPFVNLLVNQAMKGNPFQYDLIYLFWMILIALLGFVFISNLKKNAYNEDLWYQI